MQEIKLLPVIPNMVDATSFYRGQLPIADLTNRFNVGLVYSAQANWGIMALADVVFLQRPFTAEHMTIAHMAEKMGKKIWCDWDDDLFEVPEDNPSHAVYSMEETKQNIATFAAMADVVTVSTQALADKFDQIRERASKTKCEVIPNAMADFLIEKREKTDPDKLRRPLVLWRGSATHQHDLMTVTEEMVRVMQGRPEFTLHFLGYNPFWITQNLPKNQCIVAPGLDVIDYHDYLLKIQAGIIVVPLHDSPFNSAKSNIAWMEGAYGFAQCVAPNLPEWDLPGVIHYDAKRPKTFAAALLKAMQNVRANDWSPVVESWNHVKDSYRLSSVNLARWEILKGLCPHKPQEDYHEMVTDLAPSVLRECADRIALSHEAACTD